MRKLIRKLTGWAWLPVIEEAEQERRELERHRDALKGLYNDTKPWTDQLQNENARLRNLCFQMRMSFRRVKGRSMQCIPCNWPNADRLPRLPNTESREPEPSAHDRRTGTQSGSL